MPNIQPAFERGDSVVVDYGRGECPFNAVVLSAVTPQDDQGMAPLYRCAALATSNIMTINEQYLHLREKGCFELIAYMERVRMFDRYLPCGFTDPDVIVDNDHYEQEIARFCESLGVDETLSAEISAKASAIKHQLTSAYQDIAWLGQAITKVFDAKFATLPKEL